MHSNQVNYEMRHRNHTTWQLEGLTPNGVQYILTRAFLNNTFGERVLYGKRDTSFLQYATP